MEDFFANDLIERFEYMLDHNELYYFENDEFSEIIMYYIDFKDFAYAKKALNIAFDQYPDSLDLKIRELEYYISLEDLKTASILIEELRSIASEDIDFLIVTARYWNLRGMPKKAVEMYEQALELDEDKDFIYHCIGMEYMDMNDFETALINFKKALELNREDEYTLFSIIQCYEKNHDYDGCIQFLLNFIDSDPYNDIAWFELGSQYFQHKYYEEALNAFDYVVAITPTHFGGYIHKAACYEMLNQYNKAIEMYEECSQYEDNKGYTYYKIGKCWNMIAKPFKALKSFMQSIYEDPLNDMAWFEIAVIFEELGNNEEATYYVEKALEIDGENPEYLKKYAYLNIYLGKIEEAAEIFEELLKHEPNVIYNYMAYAEVLNLLGDHDKAFSLLVKAIKRFEKAELYYQLSNCCFVLKKDQEGQRYLEKALQLNKGIMNEMMIKYPLIKNRNIKLI